MILSRYNFYQKQGTHWIIYNSASANCIVLSNEAYEMFYQYQSPEEEQKKYLLLGFYVHNNESEIEQILNFSNYRLEHFKKKKFRVLTTTACNATCPYCYEAGVKVLYMSNETAVAVANFILEQSTNLRAIEIEWFGGEPLLNTSAIDTICSIIKTKKPSELKFESSIVSNGYLISEDIIEKMLTQWNLYQIQITLDGLDAEYERVKGLGKGSFKKVINNIEMLCSSDIKVVIRLNYSADNISELNYLISYLSKLEFSNKLEVYPAKINDGQQRTKFVLENETMQMYKLLHDAGFVKNLKLLPKTLKTPCAASHHGYYTINADGMLFKCDRKLLAGNSIGTIFDSGSINKCMENEWENIRLPKRCYICKLFPLCWGGCIYERLMGQDHCYITEEIVNNNLRMILNDYLFHISQVKKYE